MSVCQSVCHTASLCKKVERIEVLFVVKTLQGPRNCTEREFRTPHGEGRPGRGIR